MTAGQGAFPADYEGPETWCSDHGVHWCDQHEEGYPCMSCGAVRDMYDMQQAVDRSWWVIEGKYVCRDEQACFDDVVKTARAAGAARRAAAASSPSGDAA